MNEEPMQVDASNLATIDEINGCTSMYDLPFFKNLLEKAVSNISKLCERWETKLESPRSNNIFDVNDEKSLKEFGVIVEINEEKEGEIFAVIGKAKIMLGEKGRFRQFQNLIRDCEFGYGEKKTECSDLQGFWEMINVQVKEIENGFYNLTKLEENGWKNLETIHKTDIETRTKNVDSTNQSNDNHLKIKKKLVSKKPSIFNRKPSSGIREMMAAKRKELIEKNDSRNIHGSTESEVMSTPVTKPSIILSNISPTSSVQKEEYKPNDLEGEERVFDGGFFNISSPTSRSRRLNSLTPKSVENLDVLSLSVPSSASSTPRATPTSLRRSLLVGSARKSFANEVGSKSVTSLAILKVSSDIRRSMSHFETPTLEPVFKKLRSRTILENSKQSEIE